MADAKLESAVEVKEAHPAVAEVASLVDTFRARAKADDGEVLQSLEVATRELRTAISKLNTARAERIARWEALAAQGKLVELP